MSKIRALNAAGDEATLEQGGLPQRVEEARVSLAVVEAAYVSGAQEALDDTPEALTVLQGFISDYAALVARLAQAEQERDVAVTALRVLFRPR